MSSTRRHLLLIAAHFPPSNAIMSRRMLRFARGLSARGLRVSVITKEERFYLAVDPPGPDAPDASYQVIRTPTVGPRGRLIARSRGRQAPGPNAAPPAALSSEEILGGTGLRRRALSGLGRLLQKPFRPDDDVGWVPFVLRAAARLHRSEPIDFVLASAPPHSSLLAGAWIARRTGAAFIADYRDPWAAELGGERGLGRVGRALECWQERGVLRSAALTLFTASTARDLYREEFPCMGRAEILLNGIDDWVEGPPPPGGPPLVWLHAGLLYMGRTLSPVVRAMARLRGEVDAKLVLIGADPREERSLAKSLGLGERVEWLGSRPRRDTLQACRSAHRLVAVVSPSHPHSIPGKIFDYLSTSRPILLLCDPAHAAARLLEGLPGHRVVDPADEAEIEDLLREDAARLVEGAGIPDTDRRESRRFESAAQVEQLATWLSELAPRGAARGSS